LPDLIRHALILLASSMLSACALLPQPTIEAPVLDHPDADRLEVVPADDSRVFRVVAADLTIKTYRGGWLSGLAHDHVMTTREVGGTIHLAGEPGNSLAVIYFRPYDLVLDDPGAREQAGFKSERSQRDVAATRSRMLGPKGFDSNTHPFVQIRIEPAGVSEVKLQILLKGEAYSLEVPLAWDLQDASLRITSAFTLTHQQLGLQPYSAMLGAIRVSENIDVEMVITATPVPD
jgi:hypothetical protein